eukprot:TRINITY_DN564_c0_g1_i1.p1 TRINITY_DN564_c0_g1~~TRINITY_DN564_c0_g1_i1.p1  ORF type:complete len:832 (+),score=308.60 TRINITY_DN564_c0_g1_i1:104-2599(+)
MGTEGFFALRLRQTKILLRKNWILTKRSRQSTIIQLLVPFLFVLFLFILQLGLSANSRSNKFYKNFPNSERTSIAPTIPRCIKGPGIGNCYTMAYVANSPDGVAIMNNIASANNIPASEVRSFQTADEMDVFFSQNRNVTQAAYILNITQVAGVNQYEYTLQINETDTVVDGNTVDRTRYLTLPFQLSLQKEIIRYELNATTGNPSLNYAVDLASFPHPELVTDDIIGQNGPAFFFGALMFNLVIQTGRIVSENELKLREGMRIMGLKDSVFWFTWFVTNTTMNIISVIVLVISGYIFQFNFFLKNDFGTFFVLFLLFALSMVPVAFFLSTLVKQARTATSLGFVVFLIGAIVQGFAALVYNETFYESVRIIFSFFPFILLSKGIMDLSDAAARSESPGLRFSEIDGNAWWSLKKTYEWLILDFFIFAFLTWFCDNVIPNSYGISRPPWFMFTRSYWFPSRNGNSAEAREKAQRDYKNGKDKATEEDSDVTEERTAVLSGNLPKTTAVACYALDKMFYGKTAGCIPNEEKNFHAVKNVCWHIDAGQLFCLLGHNGAGKTTTISMLTGLYQPTGGDATIFGHSIIDSMPEIRKLMGVCPQHDILWDQLTGREHLQMFAAFKGLPEHEIQAEVEARLEDVGLVSAGNVLTSNYSGGMKRRLSTAIALTGNPQIVFLDEPTTGMDPVSRRQVWNLIQKAKQGRVILLTTHSMEEADVLGDHIAIMKKGRLEVFGSSLRLKNKFGAGYRISVLGQPDYIPMVIDFFAKNLGVTPEGGGSGFVDFGISRPLLPQLPEFFAALEAEAKNLRISDVQISMTTLEEVFLKIAGMMDDEH